MSKINILEPAVFNKIAAGEVVDRPASIVKELLENSIDAGAKHIIVEITNGGINQIVVRDDGSGIYSDDVERAFLPHATSKILTADDLTQISTLGFRGEALASIASVSQIEMLTKTTDSVTGTFLKIDGGIVAEKTEKGCPDGTYISVNNLFYNMPVRAKFLRKPKQEEGEITTLISRLILANPDVSIKYIADNKIIYNSQGTGLKDAIFSIYGTNTMQCIIPVHSTNKQYEITGFSSKTNYFKPNMTYQTLIINGRYVNNYMISQAVSRAYERYMMKQAFPFFVLNLSIPKEEVDVNVHPTKMDVKFSNPQTIFGFVYSAIEKAINDFLLADLPQEYSSNNVLLDVPGTTSPDKTDCINTKPVDTLTEDVSKESKTNSLDGNDVNAISKVLFDFNPSQHDKLEEGASALGEILIEKLQSKPIENFVSKYESLKSTTDDDIRPQPIQQKILDDATLANDLILKTKIVGKVFNTFILVEQEDKLYIVDQHAAHERLLYDKLVNDLNNKQVKKQGLLIPYTFDVNYQEYDFIISQIDLLRELGFEIESFGNLSFKVDSVPSVLADIDLGKFFNTILANVNSFLNIKTEDILRDKMAQYACKHAVKGGDDLDKEELVSLIRDVSSGKVTLQCPHGRPFVIEFTRNDFDKWFKRKL